MTLDPALQQTILLETEQALRQAVAAHQSGQLQIAEELYLAILQLAPNHPDANHNMGILAAQKNQPALPYFLAALNADPTRGQYWISCIDALIQAGHSEDARQVLALARQQGLEGEEVDALTIRINGTAPHLTSPVEKKVIHETPKTKRAAGGRKNPTPQEINTLSALLNKGRYAEAADLARKITERYPLHGLGWKGLGTALIHLGQISEALLPMQRASKYLPDDIGVHNNLGHVLQNLGRMDEAEASFRRALQIMPDYAEAHSNLGNNLRIQGRLTEAEASYNIALRLKPYYAEAHNNLGNTLWEMGRFEEAESSFRRALQIRPDFVEAQNNLGNALRELGRLDEAEASYRQALKLRPDFAESHNNIAITLKEMGRLDEAVDSLHRALEIRPDFADAHSNLGGTLRELGKLDEAVASFHRALEISPNFAKPHSNLGGALRELGRLDEALASCHRALKLNPDFAEAHSNLGGVLKELGRLDEAADSCRRALQIKPGYDIAHSNLGLALHAQGKFDEAISAYRQALALKPNLREARMNLSFSQLACGQLNEGWENHEYRIGINKNRFPAPYWAGESLSGKTILIWAEQGIGDEIMFASLFPELIAQSGHCIIECAPKLLPLFTRSFPGAQVISRTEPPPHSGFDYQCAAGSLARWLRPTPANFPQKNNFLTADPTRAACWRERFEKLGPGPKIGINWRSGLNTGERSLHYTTLDQWGPIFSAPGAHFINLQYDECSAELDEARQRFDVPLLAYTEVDMYNDIDETAALIQALDLVICAPTAVSSIAAGLGVDTWIMSYGTIWASHGTDHDLWFPSVRYFKRRWDQRWEAIIENVAEQLKQLPTFSPEKSST